MKKTGYNWLEGGVVKGHADNTDVNDNNDYNKMENHGNYVLGSNGNDDDYGNVADNDINSEDDSSGGEDRNRGSSPEIVPPFFLFWREPLFFRHLKSSKNSTDQKQIATTFLTTSDNMQLRRSS
jgi:hypothetical protein